MTEEQASTGGIPLNFLLALVALAAGAVAALVVTLLAVSTLG